MTCTAVEPAGEFVPDYLVEVVWTREDGPVGAGPHGPRPWTPPPAPPVQPRHGFNIFGDPRGGNIYWGAE